MEPSKIFTKEHVINLLLLALAVLTSSCVEVIPLIQPYWVVETLTRFMLILMLYFFNMLVYLVLAKKEK